MNPDTTALKNQVKILSDAYTRHENQLEGLGEMIFQRNQWRSTAEALSQELTKTRIERDLLLRIVKGR